MFNNVNSTLKKILVVFLIITLTYANLVLIGSNIVKGLISYAAEGEEEQPTLVANQELISNRVYEINEEEKRVIQVIVEAGIESEEYPIKESTFTLSTDIIEGTLEDVKVTNLNKNSYTSGTWDISEDGKLLISLVNENETLETKDEGLDSFIITYIFQNSEIETIKKPLQKVEVKTYSGKTLTNESIENNFENIDVGSDLFSLQIENKDIHKTIIKDSQVNYTEKLILDLSYRKETSNITIIDEKNAFYNNDGALNEELALTYKTTTINKEILLGLLGDEGKLLITDTATSKVLVELTKETIEAQEIDAKVEQKFIINEETSEEEIRSNVTVTNKTLEIEYVVDVTKFKIELINIEAQSENKIETSNFIVENTKVISNINNIDNLNYLQQDVKYFIDEEEKAVSTTITFKDTTTRASLEIDNTEWVVGEANTVKYTITLDTTTDKSELFVNPMFLIELPSSVESVNTANSEFAVNNDNGAFTNKRVFVTTILERKFVVITLEGEQTSQTIQNGDATIDLTLELNVAESTTEGNETTKLYYQNDTVTAYESGKSFDTAEVTVSMIMESEPKEEIEETVVPDDDEESEETNDFYLSLTSSTQDIIKQDSEFRYNVYLSNDGSETKQNLQLTSILPEGISIVDVIEVIDLENDIKNEMEYTFDDTTRKFTINIDKMEGLTYNTTVDEETGEEISDVSFESKSIQINVKAESLPEGTYSREIKHTMTVLEGENVLATSEEVINIVSDAFLEVEVENLSENVNELEQIILAVKVANKGLMDKSGVNIKINKPEEISFDKYKTITLLEDGQEESVSEGTISGDFEKEGISIPATKTYLVQLTGKVNYIKETKQITITGTVSEEDTITGTVNEKDFSWTIDLVNVTDEPEKPDDTTKPEDPEQPNNPENPDDTTKPENPNKPEKPDDTTKPDDSDNKTEKFDLSLNQYLNKVTVSNTKGTTTYEYTDTNFAKVEIHSKLMNGSKVTFEYKIVVKNEGTIPGYARKIVNYLPKDLTFNSELNSDWYLAEDGNIYSAKFIDKLLNPGETAELKVILEKQMTNENVGTVTNLVEIYEATNNENVEDINSIPGDKLEGQNDISKVEVMIVTSTGTIILYTTLVIAVVMILGFGFYRVKKVTINKKGGC